jgi:hypothetical protein
MTRDPFGEARPEDLLAELRRVTYSLQAHLERTRRGEIWPDPAWAELLRCQKLLIDGVSAADWKLLQPSALRELKEKLEAAVAESAALKGWAVLWREELLGELSQDQQLRTALICYGDQGSDGSLQGGAPGTAP